MINLLHIDLSYHGKRALTDISLSIEPGAFIALLGPNGSGKSTLLKVLAGHLRPSAGTVLLDDQDIQALLPKQRSRRIAYFPQNRPTPNMDVYTLACHGRFPRLGFGRVMTEHDHQAVQKALLQTGLDDMAARSIESLSGGERQRAYLAMLIAQDADILLLDEPGSFLDIRHQMEVMDILDELNAQGKTIVFAAHDLPLAFSYAKRVLLLQKGTLVCDATPERAACGCELERTLGVRLEPQEGKGLFRYTLVKKRENH